MLGWIAVTAGPPGGKIDLAVLWQRLRPWCLDTRFVPFSPEGTVTILPGFIVLGPFVASRMTSTRRGGLVLQVFKAQSETSVVNRWPTSGFGGFLPQPPIGLAPG